MMRTGVCSVVSSVSGVVRGRITLLSAARYSPLPLPQYRARAKPLELGPLPPV